MGFILGVSITLNIMQFIVIKVIIKYKNAIMTYKKMKELTDIDEAIVDKEVYDSFFGRGRKNEYI